jgi:dephospho-CoA kinase
MLKVGLTGGYATGKSFVAKELQRLGCLVIYADQLGHSVLLPGGEAYQPTVGAFGPDILQPDGTIDRKKLAAVVFTSPDLLEKLNSFVHPAVFRLEQEMMDAWQAQHPRGIVVQEAAILIETGRYKSFDRLIVTVCSPEAQVARGMRRDRATREEVLARIASQMPLEEKKRLADYVIDTSGSKQSTLWRVNEVFKELKELAERPTP